MDIFVVDFFFLDIEIVGLSGIGQKKLDIFVVTRITIKIEKGKREHDPEKIKHTAANFFKKLYSRKDVRPHPHHDKVKENILEFETNATYDDEWFNQPPTLNEVQEAIDCKRNGKTSTDLNNEMIKGTKKEFVNLQQYGKAKETANALTTTGASLSRVLSEVS